MADYVEHVEITGDASSYESALASATAKTHSASASWVKDLERTGRSMTKVGRSATTYLTLPLVGAGVAAVKMANEFSQSMANVDSIIKVSGATLEKYSQQVLDLSTEVPQTAKELADGLYDIASSGFAGAKGLQVLRAAAIAASAGNTDTATSARGVVAVLNAYGLKAKEAGAVSDILFKGVEKGVLRFDELANSMGDYVAAAAALKVPIEDVVAAQAAMTLSGINAFEAATSLNNILRSLLKPSEEMSKALKAMGFNSGQAALEGIGLQGVIVKLSERVGDNQKEWVQLFPEIRAARGAMALATDGGRNLNDVMDAMADRTGATGDAFARQAKGGAFQWQLAMNNLRKGMIELGKTIVPIVVDEIVPAIQSAVEWFTKLSDAEQSMVVKAALVVAALGPVLLVLGSLSTLAANVAGGLIRLGTGATAAAGGAASLSTGAKAAAGSVTRLLTGIGKVAPLYAFGRGLQLANEQLEAFKRGDFEGVFNAAAAGARMLGFNIKDLEEDSNLKGFKAGMQAIGLELRAGTITIDQATDSINELAEATGVTLPKGARAAAAALFSGGFFPKLQQELDLLGDPARLGAAQERIAALTDQFRRGNITFEQYEAGIRGIRTEFMLFFPEGEKLIGQQERLADSLGRYANEVIGATGVTDQQRQELMTLLPAYQKLGIRIRETDEAQIEALLSQGQYAKALLLFKIDLETGINKALQKHQDELSKAQVESIQAALKTGNLSLAMKLLKKAIDDLPKKKDVDVNVKTHGEEQLPSLQERLRAIDGTYYANIFVDRHEGRGPHGGSTAMGAIVHAARGMVVRSPTLLVGEGSYATPFGRGAEAVIPLDSRGIGILSRALAMALGDMKGRGPAEVHLHFEGGVFPRDGREFSQDVIRVMRNELMASAR